MLFYPDLITFYNKENIFSPVANGKCSLLLLIGLEEIKSLRTSARLAHEN